ncbi:Ner family transcriptional regulator [Rhodopseudomonas rhenobacensis]|uniref:Ner family transcriptional regulator n=1 Tax=Rhodopseudomonas rhenobacensis TaxID=87461 RepID=A0A7W7Z2E9_9BRAD|nr:helix-turn-helix domain-containing protein [Rhodopseudomonas rhenobacensis]MBB5046751.1 Ner family transcriptional regulator [Rhodopseudomonas rhenobacensis]
MQRWDRFSIKAEVQRRGETLTGLAIDAGLEESACRVALVRRNTRGEQAIAAYLGIPVEDLWPDRHKMPKRKTIAERRRLASQKRDACTDIGEAA